MQSINEYNKGFWFSLCVSNTFVKYAWVVPSKDKKGITNINAFQNILYGSNCKPNKIWVGKCSEFYNRSMKSRLYDNDREMYPTNNEWKSVAAERFLRTLKRKNLQMRDIGIMYIDKLDDVVVN